MRERLRQPVESGIAKWLCRYISQEVCPWSTRISKALSDESAFRAREVLVEKDARALARDLLTMSQEEFRVAFKGSPMKRAKLRGLQRNAAVVVANESAEYR